MALTASIRSTASGARDPGEGLAVHNGQTMRAVGTVQLDRDFGLLFVVRMNGQTNFLLTRGTLGCEILGQGGRQCRQSLFEGVDLDFFRLILPDPLMRLSFR